VKKILLAFLTASFSLAAAPKAVVFDWGNVLAVPDLSIAVDFICRTFDFSETEFERANLERRKAREDGKSDSEFWMGLAQKKDLQLPNDWPDLYMSVLKTSLGIDQAMYALVDELKNTRIRVGLLSNIDNRYIVSVIRDFGLYEPFDPCLLSSEIGVEKPHLRAYQILLEQIDCLPKDVIFIDDLPENITAAKGAGIDAILFKSAHQIREELFKRGLLQEV
jgi:FMN phosphatase YigB (HAD superfamily)